MADNWAATTVWLWAADLAATRDAYLVGSWVVHSDSWTVAMMVVCWAVDWAV